jgi:hypothetical protein
MLITQSVYIFEVRSLDAGETLPFTFTLYDVCCVAEPLARVVFALQSRPVTGPQLGPVPYYNSGRNTGYCGLFPSATATINDINMSSKLHLVLGRVLIGITGKHHHFQVTKLPYRLGFKDTKVFPAFLFLIWAVMQSLWVFLKILCSF